MSFLSPDNVLWFATFGAAFAAFKHAFRTKATLSDLTPNAISKGKPTPEAQWWGGYCFAAMNVGFCCIGIHAGLSESIEAKSGFLLGTGIMFECFALSWLLKGNITGKAEPKKQGLLVAVLGVIFLCASMMAKIEYRMRRK